VPSKRFGKQSAVRITSKCAYVILRLYALLLFLLMPVPDAQGTHKPILAALRLALQSECSSAPHFRARLTASKALFAVSTVRSSRRRRSSTAESTISNLPLWNRASSYKCESRNRPARSYANLPNFPILIRQPDRDAVGDRRFAARERAANRFGELCSIESKMGCEVVDVEEIFNAAVTCAENYHGLELF